jgi:hypothetical protein
VEDVLNHADLASALRNDADQLVKFLFGDSPKIERMMDLALYPTTTTDKNARLSSKAAQFLSAPARRLQQSLYRDATFKTKLRGFLKSPSSTNPVSISNFERILQMALMQQPGLLQNEFKGLFQDILEHIEYLGYRELLTHLMQEQPLCDRLYEPPAEGYIFLAEHAAMWGEELVEKKQPSEERELLTRRIVNIFSLLIELFAGTEITLPPDDLNMLQFVRFLCEAALPFDEFYPGSVVATGVQAIQAIVMNFVEEKMTVNEVTGESKRDPYNRKSDVSDYLKHFSRHWCRKWNLLDKDFKITSLTREKKWYVCTSFPVVWYAAIDPLFPLFWEANPPTTEFTQAMYYRIENMSVTRLSKFVMDHNLAEELTKRLNYSPDRNPEENGIVIAIDNTVINCKERMLALNPQIWLLIKLIVYGETSRKEQKQLPLPRSPDNRTKWDAFAQLVVQKVLPYANFLQWDELSPTPV